MPLAHARLRYFLTSPQRIRGLHLKSSQIKSKHHRTLELFPRPANYGDRQPYLCLINLVSASSLGRLIPSALSQNPIREVLNHGASWVTCARAVFGGFNPSLTPFRSASNKAGKPRCAAKRCFSTFPYGTCLLSDSNGGRRVMVVPSVSNPRGTYI